MNKLFHALFRSPGKSSLTLFVVVLAGLALSPLYAGVADAASLTVTVSQVNPNSAIQTVTCQLLKPGCVLPFVLNGGQSLNINVTYYTGGLALSFQTPNGYFYTGNTVGGMTLYHALWNSPLQGSTPYEITLFQPLAPRLLGQGATSTTAHTSVANLTITATPGP
jgi:hypothetical protein